MSAAAHGRSARREVRQLSKSDLIRTTELATARMFAQNRAARARARTFVLVFLLGVLGGITLQGVVWPTIESRLLQYRQRFH